MKMFFHVIWSVVLDETEGKQKQQAASSREVVEQVRALQYIKAAAS